MIKASCVCVNLCQDKESKLCQNKERNEAAVLSRLSVKNEFPRRDKRLLWSAGMWGRIVWFLRDKICLGVSADTQRQRHFLMRGLQERYRTTFSFPFFHIEKRPHLSSSTPTMADNSTVRFWHHYVPGIKWNSKKAEAGTQWRNVISEAARRQKVELKPDFIKKKEKFDSDNRKHRTKWTPSHCAVHVVVLSLNNKQWAARPRRRRRRRRCYRCCAESSRTSSRASTARR